MSGTNTGSALSMRERAEIDAVFGRVRGGEHYTVLGVADDALAEVIHRAHAKLSRWVETLEDRAEDLGEYLPRVQLISSALQNAWRILGNPLMRLRYDEQRRTNRTTEKPAARPADTRSVATEAAVAREVTEAHRPSRVQALGASGGRGSGPPGTAATGDSRSGLLVALLEAHLGAAFGGSVSLVGMTGETAAVYGRRAEDAEVRGEWFDAVVLWHAALMATPDDVNLVRRAASAMKAAGASSDLLRGYNHRADVMDQSAAIEGAAKDRKPTR